MITGVVTLSLLAACTPTPGSSGPATIAPSSEKSTIAPPPATTSPGTEAAKEVERAVLAYYDRTDALLSDPQLPIEQATDIAAGIELDELRRLLQEERADGRRQTGQAIVGSLEVIEVDLTPPATAMARICLDVTGVDVVDANGASVVLPEREARSVVDLNLVEQDATGWVVDRTEAEGIPCAE
jgi:hypothetical protein